MLTKKSLDKHRNQCRGASFTCLDCMVWFHGTDYRSHTSCMSEAQKVQGHLYKEKDKKRDKRKSVNGDGTMVPRQAYVEDAPEGDESQSQAVAIVDVPPRAPTPPSAAPELPADVNVFDFLVSEATPNGASKNLSTQEQRPQHSPQSYHQNGDSQYSQFSNDGSQYNSYGFSYGHAPIEPTFTRYDSWQNLNESQQSQSLMPPPAYVTPAPKGHRREEKDRSSGDRSTIGKRKRGSPDHLDLSTKRPSSHDEMMIDAPSNGHNGRVLHSGLTGGLNRLITDPEFLEDRIEAGPTPILSPIKRSKKDENGDKKTKREQLTADERKSRRASSYISHSTTTIKPSTSARQSDTKHSDDKHDRSSRGIERKYHDDSHHRRRPHSAERTERLYHDDREPHRRRHQRESLSSEDRAPRTKAIKQIEYIERPASVQPSQGNQIVSYRTRADLFMSFVQKGPDSERGCSINKVLKRYHRERDVRGEEKEDEDKELWKNLRLRRNDRGEIVLFV